MNAAEAESLFNAGAIAAAAQRAALRAAALVNRLWFAIAVPLLWAWPDEKAPNDKSTNGISYAGLLVPLESLLYRCRWFSTITPSCKTIALGATTPSQ
jgi:hypothetical protein